VVASFLFACGSTSSSDSPHAEPSAPCVQADADGRVPCGDFGNVLGTTRELFVVGRIVAEKPGFDVTTATPRHDLSQTELPAWDVQLRFSDGDGVQRATFDAKSDDEGWVSLRSNLSDSGLAAGHYQVEVWASKFWLASFRARLLPADYQAPIVVSDIDLTYLDTDFQTAGAALALLDDSAAERATLPAMPLVYQGLRSGAQGTSDRPLTYLSGSPLFFRRVLQGRMDLDRIQNDGIALKPLQLLLTHELLEGLETGDLLRALGGDTDALLGSLDDQLGFKLTALLAQQLNLPVTTRVVLLGDDSEMDAVTYALFHRTLVGELTTPQLLETLDELSVDGFWRDAIERLLPQVQARRKTLGSPVDGIFINRTDVPNPEQPASAWVVDGLSRHHRGAWPLALELEQAGWVSASCVAAVHAQLLDQGVTQPELDAAERAAVEQGFLEAK